MLKNKNMDDFYKTKAKHDEEDISSESITSSESSSNISSDSELSEGHRKIRNELIEKYKTVLDKKNKLENRENSNNHLK